MRIAVVTTSWPAGASDPGGHFVAAEVRALARVGHEVLVLAPTKGGAFGWPGVASRVHERPLRAIDALKWVAATRVRVATMEVERVIAHWAVPCAWPIGIGARDAALEAVSHGGDVRLLTALPSALRHIVVDAIATRAQDWRFASEPLMVDLLCRLDRRTRAKVERIAFVRPAVMEMPDVRDAVVVRRRALGKLRIAVSVGRLVASKRVDRAIDYVAKSRELDTLVVVGDGPERGRLARFARELRVDARFVGVVPREDALAWIGAANVLLHASEAEGMSTVVREARELGTPVDLLAPHCE